mmetsp:Transcript_46931/g.147190  ORF Transcript_46931/g.147190 Transcript_46931/m.147190 type:complete len:262 (+) Transcript_46931:1313-2098(+)
MCISVRIARSTAQALANSSGTAETAPRYSTAGKSEDTDLRSFICWSCSSNDISSAAPAPEMRLKDLCRSRISRRPSLRMTLHVPSPLSLSTTAVSVSPVLLRQWSCSPSLGGCLRRSETAPEQSNMLVAYQSALNSLWWKSFASSGLNKRLTARKNARKDSIPTEKSDQRCWTSSKTARMSTPPPNLRMFAMESNTVNVESPRHRTLNIKVQALETLRGMNALFPNISSAKKIQSRPIKVSCALKTTTGLLAGMASNTLLT